MNKEIFRPQVAELTKQAAQHTLGRGVINMENGGDRAPRPQESKPTTNVERRLPTASLERQEAARTTWENRNAAWSKQTGGAVSVDELRSQGYLISLGIPPVEGGAGRPPRGGDFIRGNYSGDVDLNYIAQDALDIQSLQDFSDVQQRLNSARDRRGPDAVNRALAQQLSRELKNMGRAMATQAQTESRKEERRRQRYVQYIGPSEEEDLESRDRDRIMKWLETAFDRLYQRPIQGALRDSTDFQDFDAAYREARRLIKNSFDSIAHEDPSRIRDYMEQFNNIMSDLDNVFDTTFRNIVMKGTITSSSKIEEIMQVAKLLKGHFLFNGFTMEGGNVGAMYQMIDDYAETRRLLSPNQHLMTETITEVNGENTESQFMQYQIKLALSGNGPFALDPRDLRNQNLTEDEREVVVTRNIVRAARTAHSLWVNTQRQAVIGARGRKFEAEQYQTDPVGGPFIFFNPEEFFAEKWGARTAEELLIKEATKLALAYDYLQKNHPGLKISNPEVRELADRMFKEFINIADIFSSGTWRIPKMLEAIQDRCSAIWGEGDNAKQRAENMAIFMRIRRFSGGRLAAKYTGPEHEKRAGWEKDNRELSRLWSKAAQFHPDEIVRLWQERIADDVTASIPEDDSLNSPNERFQYSPRCRELYRRFHTMFTEGDGDSNVFIRNGIRHYKDFKEFKVQVNGQEVLLPEVINSIRQEGYSMIEQVDFANPKQWAAQMLVATLGRDMAQDVVAMYSAFSRFSEGSIDILMNGDKFEDLYMAGSKTLKTDDAILNQLELKNFSRKTLAGIKALATGTKEVIINGQRVNLTVTRTVREDVHNRIEQLIRDRKPLFTPLSQKFAGGEGRGDVYVRTLSDSGAAEAALTTHMYEIFHAEGVDNKAKAAEALYNAVKNYNGIDNAVQGVLYAFGVYLDLVSLDPSLDIIGVGGRPLRQAASDAQRILGVQAEALNQDKRLELADHFKHLFIETAGALSEEEKKLSPEEQERLRRERTHGAEQAWHSLRGKAKVRRRDLIGIRFWRLLLYFLAETGIEAFKTLDIDNLIPKK